MPSATKMKNKIKIEIFTFTTKYHTLELTSTPAA